MSFIYLMINKWTCVYYLSIPLFVKKQSISALLLSKNVLSDIDNLYGKISVWACVLWAGSDPRSRFKRWQNINYRCFFRSVWLVIVVYVIHAVCFCWAWMCILCRTECIMVETFPEAKMNSSSINMYSCYIEIVKVKLDMINWCLWCSLTVVPHWTLLRGSIEYFKNKQSSFPTFQIIQHFSSPKLKKKKKKHAITRPNTGKWKWENEIYSII